MSHDDSSNDASSDEGSDAEEDPNPLTEDSNNASMQEPEAPSKPTSEVDPLNAPDKPKGDRVFVRGLNKENAKKGRTLPSFDVEDLLGRTFLKDEEVDGTVYRGIIIKELDRMDAKAMENPALRKFLCRVGLDKHKEILTYNEICAFMDNDDYDRLWKYCKISGH